jgi:hypothetical protein
MQNATPCRLPPPPLHQRRTAVSRTELHFFRFFGYD